MTEQQLQAKKIKQLENKGFYVIKLTTTNKNGIPDLIALRSDRPALFVEVKTPKGKVSPLQRYRIKELKKYGFEVEVCRGL
tara:strand:+ start:166 stop:408 length:243 start_codon:yes stop_codon:yes gene_type:complete